MQNKFQNYRFDRSQQYQYNGAPYRQDKQFKKHSGCKLHKGFKQDGKEYICVSGWNYRKSEGLTSFFAKTYSGTTATTSKSGREWLTVVVEVKTGLRAPHIVPAIMDAKSGKVIIQKMGIVMNPKAKNGGYVGKFTK